MISAIALDGGQIVIWNHLGNVILKIETQVGYQGLVLSNEQAHQLSVALERAAEGTSQ